MEDEAKKVVFHFEDSSLNERLLDVKMTIGNTIAVSSMLGSLLGQLFAYKDRDENSYNVARDSLIELLSRFYQIDKDKVSDDELRAMVASYQEQAALFIVDEMDKVIAQIVEGAKEGKVEVKEADSQVLSLLIQGKGEELSEEEIMKLIDQSTGKIVSA